MGTRTAKSFKREDKFEYPIEALREAIINALIHRNYFELADIRVFIFDNRVEIISPGTFPKGTTPQKPRHIPVNPILCQLFYDVGLIEKYGSGIRMMKDLSQEWGNKKPYYDLHLVESTVIFESQIKESTYIDIGHLRGLNQRQQKGLECLEREKKITNEQYQKINNTNRITAFRDLKVLVDKNVIEKVGKTGKYTYYIMKR